MMEDKLLEELYASYKDDAYAAHLEGVVEKYGDMQVAEMILNQYEDSLKPDGNTVNIGFQVNYHLFWKNVKKEFDKLVCGNAPYEREEQDGSFYGKFFTLATASSMAATIKQSIMFTDIPIYILTPAIALMLHSVMKVGRNAYCSTVNGD